MWMVPAHVLLIGACFMLTPEIRNSGGKGVPGLSVTCQAGLRMDHMTGLVAHSGMAFTGERQCHEINK